ncbi:MAG TPA: DUF1285 domain-containing protein [Desulfarculaceae bacterium]|nr:DUF1285 domain-containing protein [Desulfarculaceae bacterium]
MEIGQSEILINAQGEWWHEGNRIVHPEVLKLFKSSLVVDPESGEFFIDYKGKRAPVKVTKTPYFIRDAVVEKSASGNLLKVVLEVDDGSRETLEPETLALDGEGVLQVKIKAGRFAARCLAAAHFRIAELLEDDDSGNFFIVINGIRFSVSRVN